jgi:hypothetical protein
MSTSIKLPKQWKQWLRKAGFKIPPKTYGLGHNPVLYWEGFGRHWRVNCHQDLEVSKTFDQFDRWANSCFYTTNGIPQTEVEFLERIAHMRKRVERKERLRKYFGLYVELPT